MNDTEPTSNQIVPPTAQQQNIIQKWLGQVQETSPWSRLIAVGVIFVMLFGSYIFFSYQKSQETAAQRINAAENLASNQTGSAQANSNKKWFFNGRVKSINDTSITIKTANGQLQTANIDAQTKTSNSDGSALAPRKIIVDTPVNISGISSGPGPSTASQIQITGK